MSGKTKYILIFIFLVGAGLRFADCLRPINRASWRECDLGAVSRNYALESMNPFYPRVDWRGNSPGYAEMEFPLYPYLTAITYKIFGFHDYFGRIWAFLFSLGTPFFFYKLAREYLGDFSLIFAFAFFAFNPLIVEFSTSIQPEGLMILCYTASVYFFLEWLKTEENKDFWFAAIATVLTLLAKATAAHIGLFFGVLLLQKYGFGIFKKSRVWLFGLISLLPALLWYAHAKSLWKNYGNSLGVSNEYHWVGADFFTNSYFIKGILFSEFSVVWIYFGAIVALFAVFKGFREKTVRQSLLWLACVFVMYVIAARTTADDWASYYHIFSIPPAALVFGFGVGKLSDAFASLFNFYGDFSRFERLKRVLLVAAVGLAVFATFALEAKQIRANLLQNRAPDESFACARQLKPAMPREGLILVSGSHCVDPDGYMVAYNASFMFYWLDRKGFNICTEEQTVEKVKEFAAQGAKYFVAQKSIVAQKPNFEAELKSEFPLIAECYEFYVFEIGN
jgi:4-amino-4-deoxy-L-arabinose transferase-like glycosyltransferase